MTALEGGLVFNGYLLIAVCNFDDIPVQFFAKRRDAIRSAKTLPPPKSNPLGSMDITGFIGAKVMRFRNGRPIGKATFFEASDEGRKHGKS